MKRCLPNCSLFFSLLVACCLDAPANLYGQHIQASDTQVSFELPLLSDSLTIAIEADWSDGQFSLMFRFGDPILDKPGNIAPTGTILDDDGNVTDPIPTGPTYDPNTGPHKPPKYWEPIDHTTIPVFRGGATIDAGTSLNTDPTTGNVIPNDQNPKKPKSPKGPSVNTDPDDPNVVNNGGPHIIVWMPEDLEIVQQGGGQPGDENANPPKPPKTHGVIQPKIPMSLATYKEIRNC